MVPRGLEPRTLRLLAVRSNQLSYETSCDAFVRRHSLPASLIHRFRAPSANFESTLVTSSCIAAYAEVGDLTLERRTP